MCARRFLIIVFIFTLMMVAAAFTIFEFGGNVLLKQATPKGHFEAAEAGGGPDYTQDTNWVARPGLQKNPALWLPDEAAPSGTAPAETNPGVEGRRTATEVTIFKSLGLAVEDVAAANLAYRRAIDQDVGTELEL